MTSSPGGICVKSPVIPLRDHSTFDSLKITRKNGKSSADIREIMLILHSYTEVFAATGPSNGCTGSLQETRCFMEHKQVAGTKKFP